MSEKYERGTHLSIIQDTINRVAGNSLQCKTWAMMLFSALAVIILGSGKVISALFTSPFVIIMLIVFWSLDAWYLQMERRLITLYNDVRKEEVQPDTSDVADPYRMDFKKYPEQWVVRIMFSISVWPVYLPPVLVTVVALIVCITLFCCKLGYLGY